MADQIKARMNLVAIKKADPYAKDIINSSSHVAFYTFNAAKNEWEKTDVEGAFFIYSRNAQPYHSIFINNRLNTTSFVEPITSQLELQSQPPFLLYRNERSRIRGFWFYNSEECDRIGSLISSIVQKFEVNTGGNSTSTMDNPELKDSNVNIFKMLSKAQQEYNSSQNSNGSSSSKKNQATCNVLEFFASAKSSTAAATGELPLLQRVLPNTLSVEQIEKRQRSNSPRDSSQNSKIDLALTTTQSENLMTPDSTYVKTLPVVELETRQLKLFSESDADSLKSTIMSIPSAAAAAAVDIKRENYFEQLYSRTSSLNSDLPPLFSNESMSRPALMPPTMFETTNTTATTFDNNYNKIEPLSRSQMVQAFTYLMQNDDDFVQKLHEAYLKIAATKPLIDTYQ